MFHWKPTTLFYIIVNQFLNLQLNLLLVYQKFTAMFTVSQIYLAPDIYLVF